jgi:Lipopolysaccharide-assembly
MRCARHGRERGRAALEQVPRSAGSKSAQGPAASLLAVLLACLSSLLAACGWHTGLVVPAGAERVRIEFFENRSLLPNLEQPLEVALTSAVLERVPIASAGAGPADLILSGRILDFRRHAGVRSQENVQLESGDELTVEAELVEVASGRILRTSRRSLAAGFAIDPLRSAATTADEPLARERLLRNLADGLVLDLFGPTR